MAEALPPDLVAHVGRFLSLASLVCSTAVRRSWRRALKDNDTVWRAVCASEWPERSEWQVAAPTWRDRCYIYKSVLPRGVLLELPQSFLDGWVCHMDRPYAAGRHLEEWAEEHDRPQTEHPAITHPADLDSVPAGTFVFVGARAPDGSLEMGAVGVRDAVFAYTGQPPALRESHIAQEHNGLYWYRVRTGGNDGVDDDDVDHGSPDEDGAFGFASVPAVLLSTSDCEDLGEANEERGRRRLSWALDGVSDGWRCGLISGDNFSSRSVPRRYQHPHDNDNFDYVVEGACLDGYRKLIYYLRLSDPAQVRRLLACRS
ncbi:hypothetical protein EMIHUDRAFT_461287 [Emiliania huxleyi CCMP1516]|uniref:F-box domain-containing protein n=3 Tax=Emiliania huxleyi TaxID=2903 RepID=A0A0D3J3A6_EMIH1|nr:hypothetical protein EMIHUDRAFT_461287 [Emiliania huxleyi CCMP1516]EOD17991.1 hypothetical protein EMIHUDRAFT_461287 [Emiliania huxleyi CCMP1516]|eukprot:XP_005770420.1 hypothetical protein EMIHUDRAFT_461287 [Emiliania huxleyi CCMP1516]